jgi:hypothetical protein
MIKLIKLLKETVNQDLYIGKSNIHGDGLFSNISILSNETFTPIGDATLLPDEDALNIYGKHINHSANPNATVEITDTDIVLNSIKPINAGDEIVVDYTALPLAFDRNIDGFILNENKRTIHVKNVNYYQQLLNQANKISVNDRNYIQGVIDSIKKYNGMATEAQYNFLKRRLG